MIESKPTIEDKKKELTEEAINILTSAEELLKTGDFDGAGLKTIDFFELDYTDRQEPFVDDLWGKYAQLYICEKCSATNLFSFGWTQKPRCYGYIKPPCPECEKAKQREENLKNVKYLMKELGVPKRFMDANINEFSGLEENESGLYIVGPCGTGKTHYLSALMREKILSTHGNRSYHLTYYYNRPESSDYPRFISIPDLLLKIRSTFSDDSTTEEEIIERYSNIGILMLDDIGSEKPTEWVLQTLYLIIDHRYRELKETYITSNLSLDQLAARLSDRIASRIAGMCKVLKLDGKDRRIE